MPTRSDESRCPSMTSVVRESCCKAIAISSRHALCSLLILAELNGKNIGPHGLMMSGRRGGGGISRTVMLVEQLPPGHGSPHRMRSVLTLTVTVTEPIMPVVSRETCRPVLDESLPPVADQMNVRLSVPEPEARNITRSPSVTVVDEAMTLQVTLGHGGSVTSNEATQVESAVLSGQSGWPVPLAEAVTIAVAVYVPQVSRAVGTSTPGPLPLTLTARPCESRTSQRYS